MQWTSDPIRLLRHILMAALLSSSSLTHADLIFF